MFNYVSASSRISSQLWLHLRLGVIKMVTVSALKLVYIYIYIICYVYICVSLLALEHLHIHGVLIFVV